MSKRSPIVIGYTSRECPVCGDIQRCPVYECGPHREARCGKCGSHTGFVSKRTAIEPAHQLPPAGEFAEASIDRKLPTRNEIAIDFAIRYLSRYDLATGLVMVDATIDRAIDEGFNVADRVLARCS